MTKFKLRDRLRIIRDPDIRTVREIREMPDETLYCVQLGGDIASRMWARESDLERAD